MKKVFYVLSAVIVLLIFVSCMTPMTTPPPSPDVPKPAPMPDENKKLKKMCVGHDCRNMGAVDGGGTTRGHTDEKTD